MDYLCMPGTRIPDSRSKLQYAYDMIIENPSSDQVRLSALEARRRDLEEAAVELPSLFG